MRIRNQSRAMFFIAILCLLAPGVRAADTLSALDRLAIQAECTDLLLTYGEGLDNTDPQKIWPLFAKDGTWQGDNNKPVQGQSALRDFWTKVFSNKRPTVGRHIVTNVRISVIDADHASGSAYVTQYRYDPEHLDKITSLSPNMLVTIKMDYVRFPEGWRFQTMHVNAITLAGYEHGKG